MPSNCAGKDSWKCLGQQGLTAKIDNKPVNLEGDQPRIFNGRTDGEAETPVFWSSDSHRLLIGKVPDAGKSRDKSRRRRGHQRIRWLDSNTNASNMNLGKVQEMVKDREAWHAAVHGVARVRHYWVAEQHQQQQLLVSQLKVLPRPRPRPFPLCFLLFYIFRSLTFQSLIHFK